MICKIKAIPAMWIGMVFSVSVLMGCVGNDTTKHADKCEIRVDQLSGARKIDLVSDLLPREAPMLSLQYYPDIKSILAISDSGACVRRIDMMTDRVSQYPRLIGVMSAITLYDQARTDFTSFLKLESARCERNPELYRSGLPYARRATGGDYGPSNIVVDPMSLCGQLIHNQHYVANVQDGEDMVTVDVFGETIFVARKKWQ